MPTPIQRSRLSANLGACDRPSSFFSRVYTRTSNRTNGRTRRRKSGEITVTSQAPAKEASKPAKAAGQSAAQRISTRWLYCQVAKAVPQTEAPLLVPNKVAGWACGKVANSAGTRIKPPPPTIESTKPAKRLANETIRYSMPTLSHPGSARNTMLYAAKVTYGSCA